jgi:adenylate cyclase
MGSDLRFDYSVLGDIVNLTSRLEGQSKTYGVAIIAGAKTVQMAGERFATIELDRIRVKGKTEPETVYGIFGGPQIAASDDFRRVRDLSTQMLECYRRRDWQNAINSIGMAQGLAQRYHLGTFFQLYTSRIENHRRNPPSDDWDGVYVAHEK